MNRRPETAGPAIADLPKRRDALLVLDVDEVVLHFVKPFEALLAERGARLHFDSFALHGNVRSIATGAAVSGREISGATSLLYEEQEGRQTVVDGVEAALHRLEQVADIVFLTAMEPRYHAQRRRLLDRAGLGYPLLSTERAKGGVLCDLGERWSGPIAFVDDLPQNLHGARRSFPRAVLLHLMANEGLRPHLPPLPAGALSAADWGEAEPLLRTMLAEAKHGDRQV